MYTIYLSKNKSSTKLPGAYENKIISFTGTWLMMWHKLIFHFYKYQLNTTLDTLSNKMVNSKWLNTLAVQSGNAITIHDKIHY